MKYKMLLVSILAAALSAFAIGAAAQHDEHHADQQPTPDQSTPGMMGQGQGMMGGTTGTGMMGMMTQMNQMMGQMTTHHQQMTGLMTQMLDGMNAIGNEKDPAALRQKLGEHRKLMEQMRSQMVQQGGMMQNMSEMMMGSNTKSPAK